RLPDTKFPARNSLTHTVLKSMAKRWDYHLLYDNVFLAELPDSLKQLLLSYVAYYTPHDVVEVGMRGLKPLFLDISVDTGMVIDQSAVSRLDLENAVGRWVSIRQLTREVKGWTEDSKAKTRQKTREKAKTTTTGPAQIGEEDEAETDNQGQATPASWEDEIDTPSSKISSPLINQPSLSSRFPSLRYLSLANPHGTQSASWSSLLSLLPNISRLTHLSLAYWPAPTLTPNSLRARISHPTVSTLSFQYGGTDIYSAYEDDWHEAASVLRRVSKATYCLKWLDLEGCMEWVDALTYGYSGTFASSSSEGESSAGEDGLIVKNGRIGPEWNGSWRTLEWLRLSVGWRPEDEAWAMNDAELHAVRQAKIRHEGLTAKAEAAGRRILDIRKQGKRKWIYISHGEEREEKEEEEEEAT
ncbi:large subunit of alpha-aminoadipate reductase, partial [Ascosphaera pollenicola]